jgi:protein-disulfide isomerase
MQKALLVFRRLVLFCLLAPALASASNFVSGSTDAKVQILVFGDFQCPYTKTFMSYIPQLEQEYGETVGIKFAHFPLDFHPEAMNASVGAHCAGQQGEFRKYSELLFENQKKLNPSIYTELAERAGIQNLFAFEKCRSTDQAMATINDDKVLGRALAINGTPNIYINGYLVRGAYPIEHFKTIIDEQLKKPN